MRTMFVLTMSSCLVLGAIALRAAAAQPSAPSGVSVNDKGVVQAAKFAVEAQQQAMKAGGKAEKLALVKIVAAQKQVVSGISYALTLQVKDGGVVKTAEAKVWEQAWQKEPSKLVSWKFADEKGEGEAKPASGKDAEAPKKDAKTAPGKAKDADAPKAGKTLKYATYADPYFVQNTYEPKAAQSFAVLKSLADFDGIFHVGMVMGGKNPPIDNATFKSQIVVAVVKRGSMCHYTVESVVAKGKGLEVRYKVKEYPPGSGEYSVPLILAVPKGEYFQVMFVENGKEVKVLK